MNNLRLQKIYLAAGRLFDENGYANTKMAENAVGIMYSAFTGKDTVLFFVIYATLDKDYLSNEITLPIKPIESTKLIMQLRRVIDLVENVMHVTYMEGNICMADPNCEKVAMVKAAEHAKISGFIESLEKGYDTQVNTTVRMVSNGQIQRINLVRAFLKDTEIFLLDEPTAALDNESELQILNTIQNLKREGKGVLMITHKLSSLNVADRIFRIEEGEILQ